MRKCQCELCNDWISWVTCSLYMLYQDFLQDNWEVPCYILWRRYICQPRFINYNKSISFQSLHLQATLYYNSFWVSVSALDTTHTFHTHCLVPELGALLTHTHTHRPIAPHWTHTGSSATTVHEPGAPHKQPILTLRTTPNRSMAPCSQAHNTSLSCCHCTLQLIASLARCSLSPYSPLVTSDSHFPLLTLEQVTFYIRRPSCRRFQARKSGRYAFWKVPLLEISSAPSPPVRAFGSYNATSQYLPYGDWILNIKFLHNGW